MLGETAFKAEATETAFFVTVVLLFLLTGVVVVVIAASRSDATLFNKRTRSCLGKFPRLDGTSVGVVLIVVSRKIFTLVDPMYFILIITLKCGWRLISLVNPLECRAISSKCYVTTRTLRPFILSSCCPFHL